MSYIFAKKNNIQKKQMTANIIINILGLILILAVEVLPGFRGKG